VLQAMASWLGVALIKKTGSGEAGRWAGAGISRRGASGLANTREAGPDKALMSRVDRTIVVESELQLQIQTSLSLVLQVKKIDDNHVSGHFPSLEAGIFSKPASASTRISLRPALE
jgi:hypothetical protein